MTRRCPPPRKTPRLRPKAPVEVRREPFSIALAPDEPADRVPPDLDDTRPRSIHNMTPDCPPGFEAGPMIEHGENDLETFREFFKSLGVPFDEFAGAALPPHATDVLWVAGASFTFDARGSFLGVVEGHSATFTARR